MEQGEKIIPSVSQDQVINAFKVNDHHKRGYVETNKSQCRYAKIRVICLSPAPVHVLIRTPAHKVHCRNQDKRFPEHDSKIWMWSCSCKVLLSTTSIAATITWSPRSTSRWYGLSEKRQDPKHHRSTFYPEIQSVC